MVENVEQSSQAGRAAFACLVAYFVDLVDLVIGVGKREYG